MTWFTALALGCLLGLVGVVVVGFLSSPRRRPDTPEDVDDGDAGTALPVGASAVVHTPDLEARDGLELHPVTRKPGDPIEVLWEPDPRRFNDDPDYRHACRQFIAAHLPAAGISDAYVFEDDAGRWLAAPVYDFDARRFTPARVALSPLELLP